MTKNNRCMICRIDSFDKPFDLLLYLDEKDHPVEIHPQPLHRPSLVGNIYIAKVETILPQINACFLKTKEDTFFCSLENTDISHMIITKKNGRSDVLCQGDEILVQVLRDAIKSKEIFVTTNLSFSSQNILITTGNSIHGISKKITGEDRNRLENEVRKPLDENAYGFILRTSAKDCSSVELLREFEDLCEEVDKCLTQAKHLAFGSLIKEAQHPFVSHIQRYIKDGLSEVVTEDDTWFTTLQQAFSQKIPLRRYQDDSFSLQQLYGILHMLEQAQNKKVYLNSGASLVIEPTEALTVIDVNSGNNIKKKKDKDYFLEINKEAAREIARQLRLRNISGIVLVDFINLKDKQQKQSLLFYMKDLLKNDYVKANVVDFTRLDLMEITRAKKYPSLTQMIQDCS